MCTLQSQEINVDWIWSPQSNLVNHFIRAPLKGLLSLHLESLLNTFWDVIMTVEFAPCIYIGNKFHKVGFS